MKKINVLIILMFSIFLLMACGPLNIQDTRNTPSTTQTATSSAEYFSTPSAEDTSPDSTLEAPTPIPSGPPPPRPLDEIGPWLFFYQTGERGQITEVYTANLDGTALTPILSPLIAPTVGKRALPSPRVTAMEISPRGDFLALQAQYSPLEITLWLLQLPSGEVRQRLSLIGDQAQFKLLDYYPSGYIPVGLPSPLPVSFLWSPDGRTLALSAAIDGPSTDIYTYDLETNGLNRLTAGPGEAVLMGWSPDGAWIVHQALSANTTTLRVSDGVFALSSSGETLVQLYNPTVVGEEIIVGWVSNRVFLSYSSPTGAPASLLRQADINAGSAIPLLAAIFSDAALVPETNQILIDLFGFINWTPEIVPGIHHYDPDNDHFKKILPGGYSLLTWVPELGLFAAAQRVAETEILYFDIAGEGHFSIPRSHPVILWPLPSPDGHWLLSPFKDSFNLYDIEGNLVSTTIGLGQVIWLPDASGFIQVGYAGAIFQYLLVNEWAPQILNPEFSPQGTFQIISQ